MFKNLCPSTLGISGRQSEIIELTLTYGFRGLDLEVDDFAQRAKAQGLDNAIRFLTSAKIRIGSVDLPVRWRSDDVTYQADLAELDQVASYAAKAKVYACKTVVFPESDRLPYHENFELHRKRLAEIAEVLGKHNIRLAVGFHAAQSRREGKQFQFIQEADALSLLLKSVAGDNIGLWLDTWNWYVGGGTISSLKGFGIDKVAYVTIADAPQGVDRKTLNEEQRMLPAEDGAANIEPVVALLKEHGYNGPITLSPNATCFNGMKNDDILKQCKAVLDGLLTTVEAGKKLVTAGADK
ncbi:MAG: sugar phosphate isomerase/epimerase [Planctomycetaceae bacterium]|nr:sugar phosphate isomerase/epimerase [Planctomycetales bacterium]MCB9927099.1 sugar phosphate isomerase/epimerase [Planctomycetaceae bacterium]